MIIYSDRLRTEYFKIWGSALPADGGGEWDAGVMGEALQEASKYTATWFLIWLVFTRRCLLHYCYLNYTHILYILLIIFTN